jgi:outer membrane receptor protein involved in Fe transport
MQLSLTGGAPLAGPVAAEHPTLRLVALASPRLQGGSALLAAEISHTDGPFESPQRFRRGLGFAKWRIPVGPGELTLTANLYGASWDQSGQIPERAVDAGALDRFGAVDPTEGGESQRGSLAARYAAPLAGGRLTLQGYGVYHRLQLFSNFTLFARDAENGDQIEQGDERVHYGLTGRWVRPQRWGQVAGTLTAGVQLRGDRIDTDLWHTRARARVAACFDEGQNPCNDVTSWVHDLALFVEEDVQLTPWLQVIAGLRTDLFLWDVRDRDPETMGAAGTTAGSAARAIVSPKLSAILRPHRDVEVFVNGGLGFHSNDARSAVQTDGDGALARALGSEIGARVRPLPSLVASAAAWMLYLQSEQVWSGDAGGTEPSDSTLRLGLDLDLTWRPLRWLTVDANLALARSRFVENRGNAGALALAPRLIGGAGVTVRSGGGAMLALRARGVADRPANDEGTLTADGFFVMDLVASYPVTRSLELGITAYNLTNTAWREAQFAEESRLQGEPMPVEDVHFTPGAPLTVLGTVAMKY